MHDFEPRPSVIRLRARLARRLGGCAAAGLLALLALALLLASAVAACAWSAWEAIGAGRPLATLMWVGAGLGCAAIALAALHALLRPAPQAQGILLPRPAAEEFFHLLDELAERAGVPPVRHVRITDEVNAAVVQRPRFGLFGPLRTELLVGLPLVHSLSALQFAAVLAHEFGHIAAQRRGWGGWGGYARAWWARVLDTLLGDAAEGDSLLGRHAARFFHDMLRLARVEELEADARAAMLVGPVLLGETLIELSRKAHFLEHDYWPRVQALRSADDGSRVRPFREMGHGVAAGYAQAVIARSRELADARGRGDAFHPSLQRRLCALRVTVDPQPQAGASAAEHFFRALLPSLAWIFDRAWWEVSRIERHPMLVPDEGDAAGV
ncbi:MAG TPA: M48 family metallopeptidase [Thauera sp.]|nr:M48 family metallopeptidase [Thauera sp.]